MAPKRARKRNAITFQTISEAPWKAIGPPSLPPEVILTIFESCTRQEMPVLCRVSKTCQSWINPLLYHTIVLEERETCRLFRRTVNAFSKRDTHASFLSTHTKVLIVSSMFISDHQLNAILVACPNITTLSTRSANIVNDMSQFENFNRLTHLNMPGLFSTAKILPVGLTHLSCDINGWNDLIKTDRWHLFLRQCPKITHLVLCLPPILHPTLSEDRGIAARAKLLSALALLPATILRIIIIFTYSPTDFKLEDVPLTTGRFSESQRTVWVQRSNKLMHNQPGYHLSPVSINAMLGWDHLRGYGEEDIWAFGDRIARRPLVKGQYIM